jgi:hypothetical protein
VRDKLLYAALEVGLAVPQYTFWLMMLFQFMIPGG